MKLDVNALRYLTKDDFRVLTAFEMGMRNVRYSKAPASQSLFRLHIMPVRGCPLPFLTLALRFGLIAARDCPRLPAELVDRIAGLK